MERSLARIKRLSKRLAAGPYDEDIVAEIDQAYEKHREAYGRAALAQFEEFSPGFSRDLVNAIHVSVRNAVDSELQCGAVETMRVCVNAVMLLDEESTGTVGIALLRGDILTVLAHGFARVAGRLDGDIVGGSSSGAGGGGSYRGGGSGGWVDAAATAELLLLQQQAVWVLLTTLTHVTTASLMTYDRGAGSELASALDRSGLLEHAAAALLRLAARLHGLAAAAAQATPVAAAPAAAAQATPVAAAPAAAPPAMAAAARGAVAPSRQQVPRAAGKTAAAGQGADAHCLALLLVLEEAWDMHREASERLLDVLDCLLSGPRGGWEALCASTDRYPSLTEPAQSGIVTRRSDADADAAAAAAAAAAEETRRLLCGPAVQLFLLACMASAGADSVPARAPAAANAAAEPQPKLWLQYPAWLPEALRLQWPDEPSSTLVRATSIAARALQATVMGRGGVLPFAQPPHGHRPGQSPRPLLPHSCPFPSAAVNVYDIAARTCHAVFARSRRAAAAAVAVTGAASGAVVGVVDGAGSDDSGGVRSSFECALKLLRLLLRLLPELRPRQAAARLPGLWRLVAAALPLLVEMPVHANQQVNALGLINEASLLLRLRLDAAGEVPPPPVFPPPPPQRQPLLVRSDTAPAAEKPEAAGVACCSYSLRCALDAGLLPVLERLLRRAVGGPPLRRPAATATLATAYAAAGEEVGEDPGALALAAAALGAGGKLVWQEHILLAAQAACSLLLESGVFPAALAHGAVAELVPLLTTIGRVLRCLWKEAGLHLVRPKRMSDLDRQAACGVVARLPVSGASAGGCWKLVVASLLQQLYAARDVAAPAAQQQQQQQQQKLQQQELQQQQPSKQREQRPGTMSGGSGNGEANGSGIGATAISADADTEQGADSAADGNAATDAAADAAPYAAADEASGDAPVAITFAYLWLLPDRIDPAWLAAAGGAPPAGTAARGQQDAMHNLLILLCVPSLFAAPAEPCLASPAVALDAALEAASAQENFFKCVLQTWFAFHAAELKETDWQMQVMTGGANASFCSTGSISSSAMTGSGGGRPAVAGGAGERQAGAAAPGGSGDDDGKDDWPPAEERLLATVFLEEWAEQVGAASVLCLHGYGEVFHQIKRAAACGGSAGAAAAAAGGEGGCRKAARGPGGSGSAGASTSGGSAGGNGGGGAQEPSIDIGGPRRPLTDTEHAVVARRVLDLLEAHAFCVVWCRMGSGVWLCPPDALPFLLMPPWALAYLERWGPLHERPWLQGLLLPAPAGGVDKWSMPNYEAAASAAIRPTAEQVARGQDAFSQLVLRIQKRIFEENWEALRWTPAALRLACDALEEDAAAWGEAAAAGAGAAAGDGASGSGTTAGASDSAAGGAQSALSLVAAPRVCGNPFCRSLDGPSALIAPGAGKTCSRCRRLAYCCGACQLEHWTQGRHRKACPELVKLNQMRQARGAAPF